MADPKIFKGMSPQFLVADLDRSILFYTSKLGFELAFRYEDFYAGVSMNGHTMHLKKGDPSPAIRAAKRENNDLDVLFSVSNVASLYDEYVAAGAEITQPLCKQPWGTEFYVADADGYILAFLQDTEK